MCHKSNSFVCRHDQFIKRYIPGKSSKLKEAFHQFNIHGELQLVIDIFRSKHVQLSKVSLNDVWSIENAIYALNKIMETLLH